MLRTRFSIFAALAAAAGSAYATAATGGGAPAHVLWAERLVAEVTPALNAYAWDPTYVVWTEDGNGAARNRSVCSSFVSHDLERAYGFGSPELLLRLGTANPQAKDYYAAILAGRGFERIARLADMLPGDVIAVRYPDGSHPTGHVMILDTVPRVHAPSAPVVAQTTQYEAAVIDSSRSFHGLLDTRYVAAGDRGSGVGRGTLRLYASAGGTVAGYAWSTRAISKFYGPDDRRLIVGRFQPSYTGPTAPPAASGDDDAHDDAEL